MRINQQLVDTLKSYFVPRSGNQVGIDIDFLTPSANNTGSLGKPNLKFEAIYTRVLYADSITSVGASSDKVDGFDAYGVPVANALLALDALATFPTSVYPNALLVDGSRTLTGNLAVDNAVTIDGVDISALKSSYDSHVANANAHHNQSHVLATTSGLGLDHTTSGLTAGQVLRATGATAAAFQAIQDADLPNTIVRTSRQVISGNGLSGGGDLSADRTLAVGAGTLITVAADTVSLSNGSAQYQVPVTGSTPFTPAWTNLSSFAGGGLVFSSGVFAVGAGNGITINADDVALTTPGTLSVSSSNNAAGNHTHAITASSDVGTTPAEALLKSTTGGALTLASLTTKGNLSVTTGGDLTVGSNVLFVDVSQLNVGINRAPDVQFDLDVNGSFRAGGYIVGKHALQLPGALLIAHYDGPEPFQSNYTGQGNGHMGQIATITQPVFMPGKFGKAYRSGISTVNLVRNPSFEVDTSSWTKSPSLESFSRVTTDAMFGSACGRLYETSTASTAEFISNANISDTPVQASKTYNFSLYIKKLKATGTGRIHIWWYDSAQTYLSASSASAYLDSGKHDWKRYSLSSTAPSNAAFAQIAFSTDGITASTEFEALVDGVMFTQTSYLRPYIDGSLGTGYAWIGTAHNSVSYLSGTATNRVTNPRAYNNTTGWTAATNVTISRVTGQTGQIVGTTAYRADITGDISSNVAWTQLSSPPLTVGQAFSGQMRVRGGASVIGKTGYVLLWESGGAQAAQSIAQEAFVFTGEWQLVTATGTLNQSDRTAVWLYVQLAGDAINDILYWTDAQVDDYTVPLAYLDGDMGTGYGWVGTAHASRSSSTGPRLQYPTVGNILPDQGTIAMWFYVYSATDSASRMLFDSRGSQNNAPVIFIASTGKIYAYGSGATITLTGATTITANQWNHVALTYDFVNNSHKLYLNAVLDDSDTVASTNYTVGSTMQIGVHYGLNLPLGGEIDDFVILDRVADEDEIRAIYESNAPVFAETSTWSWRLANNLVWADSEGLWMLDNAGNPAFGISGVPSKSWGGLTLDQGDLLIGTYGASLGGWLSFNRDGVGGLGYVSIGYATTTVFQIDNGGVSLNGVLDITTTGGIYQGTGSFSTPTTGLKVWNDTGVGRIAGFESGGINWFVDTSGKLRINNIYLDRVGLTYSDPGQALLFKFSTSRIAEIYSTYGNTVSYDSGSIVLERADHGSQLLLNPDFETDLSNWTLTSSGDITWTRVVDASVAHKGSAYLNMVYDPGIAGAGSLTATSSNIAASPGDRISGSAWLRLSSFTGSGASYGIYIQFLNSGLSVLQTNYSERATDVSSVNWMQPRVVAVAPASTAYVRLIIIMNYGAGTTFANLLIDDCSLTKLSYYSSLSVVGNSSAQYVNVSNDLIVGGDLYTNAFTDYSATSTITGWSSYTTKQIWYKRIGKVIIVWFDIQGTSNSTTTSFTIPWNMQSSFTMSAKCGRRDNGTWAADGIAYSGLGTATIDFKIFPNTAWTSSGTKAVLGQAVFQLA